MKFLKKLFFVSFWLTVNLIYISGVLTDLIILVSAIYGTRHVLVLADFHTSTRTTDLEKLLESFKDRFVIRWVNDTTALAVFRTPSVGMPLAY